MTTDAFRKILGKLLVDHVFLTGAGMKPVRGIITSSVDPALVEKQKNWTRQQRRQAERLMRKGR